MAFVNEYVSAEDIEKYNLVDIWLEHNPLYRKEGKLPPGYEFEWAFDRARNVYLTSVGGYGREDDYMTWVLYWRQQPVTLELSKPGLGSKSFQEKPYRIVWALGRIYRNFIKENERQDFITFLKEALVVYGYAGARKQIPDTVVSFIF